MKRKSTLLLGGLTALIMAACNAPRNDTTTGGTGSETGSMSGSPATTDTTATGATGTGAASDGLQMNKDTTVR
jgi:hypothetical protein